MIRAQWRRRVTLLPMLAVALAACTGGDGAATADGDGGEASTVAVALQEWAVVPEAESAPAGEITFEVTNDGPEDVHEFVVVRTDLAPTDLPTDETGAVDESGEAMEVIDEIEDIPVGETQELTVELEAGSYVLICNIYSADEEEAHYAMGMTVAFDVTE